uniref:Uncharacterized protein n=1 Tax=Cyanistes caeruleus TaxID=156563 RepID=A0A8C0VF50_CYACU
LSSSGFMFNRSSYLDNIMEISNMHILQSWCRELRSGVVRDLERQNQKKENIRLLEEQIALTKQLMEERDKALMEKRSQQS